MESTHLEQIGKQIRAMRERRGMTGTELAEAIGVGKADISKIENGNRNLTIGTLTRIAKALDCRLDLKLKSQ